MNIERKASIAIIKIICVSLILLALSGAGVIVMATQVKTVTITLASGYELEVMTNKSNVAEILEENNIVIGENERTTPDLKEEITEDNKIVICDKSIQEIQVAKISESGIETTLDEILESYSPIIEKIVVEQETIPYETITKDASEGAADKKNKVIQSGEDGIKEITYKEMMEKLNNHEAGHIKENKRIVGCRLYEPIKTIEIEQEEQQEEEVIKDNVEVAENDDLPNTKKIIIRTIIGAPLFLSFFLMVVFMKEICVILAILLMFYMCCKILFC